jgi:probable HAF family extracellular repeat protein
MSDLGTLGGRDSYGYGLNNLGEVVGESETADGGYNAFAFYNGAMHDLNSLLPTGSGWHLQIAWAVNDAGQIVGTGELNGEQQGFLLTPNSQVPVPEPGSWLLLATCTVVFTAALERHRRAAQRGRYAGVRSTRRFDSPARPP